MKIKMQCTRCKTLVYEYETTSEPDYDNIPDECPRCHEYFDFDRHLYTDGVEQDYGIAVEGTGMLERTATRKRMKLVKKP